MTQIVFGFIVAMNLVSSSDDSELIIDQDVVYGTGGDVPLQLDLYRQRAHVQSSQSLQPGILVLFGGGFRSGNKEMMKVFSEQYARAGFVVAAANYRLLPTYRFPAPVEDVQCAVRWMRAHAKEYRIDADHLGVIGMSAGAHLAMMLGYMNEEDGLHGSGGHAGYSSKVQAVVNYAGAFDLKLRDWDTKRDSDVFNFMGGSPDEVPDVYRRASPATYIDAGDAPTLSFHGTRDPVVPYGQAVLVHAALIEHGIDSELHLLPGQMHGWWGKELQETQRLAIDFFRRHLKE